MNKIIEVFPVHEPIIPVKLREFKAALAAGKHSVWVGWTDDQEHPGWAIVLATENVCFALVSDRMKQRTTPHLETARKLVFSMGVRRFIVAGGQND